MSFAVSWDVMCDCSGCSGCPEAPGPMGCGVSQNVGLMDTKAQAAAESREMGWSISRRDGVDRARCPDCKGRREGVNVPKVGEPCRTCPKSGPYKDDCTMCFGTGITCGVDEG